MHETAPGHEATSGKHLRYGDRLNAESRAMPPAGIRPLRASNDRLRSNPFIVADLKQRGHCRFEEAEASQRRKVEEECTPESNMGRDGAATSKAHEEADRDSAINFRDVRARLAHTTPRPPAERKRPERREWVTLRKTQHRNNGGGADAVKATGSAGSVGLRESATRGLAGNELDVSARDTAVQCQNAEQTELGREKASEQVAEKKSGKAPEQARPHKLATAPEAQKQAAHVAAQAEPAATSRSTGHAQAGSAATGVRFGGTVGTSIAGAPPVSSAEHQNVSTEQQKITSTEREKKASTEQQKNPSTEQQKRASNEQRQKAFTEQQKKSSEQQKTPATEQQKKTSTEQQKAASTEQRKTAATQQHGGQQPGQQREHGEHSHRDQHQQRDHRQEHQHQHQHSQNYHHHQHEQHQDHHVQSFQQQHNSSRTLLHEGGTGSDGIAAAKSEEEAARSQKTADAAPDGHEMTMSDLRASEMAWHEVHAALGRTDDDLGLEGLTIVIHRKGRDDLVINTDLREA
ncbi:hypothetical protein MAPG_07964 [Magnaporthiopsis poae ATCC 64411]|uniref:Uncharacterized protein n=1 Tax=Magnaporthiopsis poae (strain ATCC 64411 / 73-15) TaxID=644358 RepID=A0A0C4E633_MAGP6|nr:hypothetical protein MAPG_07964 [Magnaporthiopsis poae ATCC 64411]